MMMPFQCLITTHHTFLRGCFREFFQYDRIGYGVTSLIFFGLFFLEFLTNSFLGGFAPFAFVIDSKIFQKLNFVFLVIFLMAFRDFLSMFFCMFSPASFASSLMTIFFTFMKLKFSYWFYLFTCATSFIHRSLQIKMPLASVGRVRKQEADYILSCLRFLVQNTSSTNRIITQ